METIVVWSLGYRMNQVEILCSLLEKTVSKLNQNLAIPLTLNQQEKVKKHISLSGANGRLWISPSKGGYDVSISGISLEDELAPN